MIPLPVWSGLLFEWDEDCPEMTDEQLKQFKRVHPRTEQEEQRIV